MLKSNDTIENEARPSTKDRILDASEHLFAELGFEATSLRMITGDAGVNLAAVNYHFHSKDDLIRAVLARRIQPFNKMRLERLQTYLESVGDEPVELEPVVRAFVEPVFTGLGCRWADAARLFGRTYSDPSGAVRRTFFELMREIGRPFTDAFRRALPGISQEEVLWKIYFSVGVIAHTLKGTEQLKFMMAGGAFDDTDAETVTERIVAYVVAGVRAPVPVPTKRS
jgi:AcrR family transcriptional regulator